MKLVTTRESLSRALARCADVVDRKSPNFVSSCALLTVSKDKATVYATDNILSARCDVTALSTKSGAFGMPARELLDRVNGLADGDIEIEVKDARATIKSGRRKYTLRTVPANEFASPREPTKASLRCALPSEALGSTLERVWHSIHEDVGGKFDYARIRVVAGTLEAVATDGRGGSIVREPVAYDGPEILACVTQKCVSLVRKLAADVEGEVALTAEGTFAWVSADGFELSFPLVPDTMYDIDTLCRVPPIDVRASKLALCASIKAIGVAATDKQHAVAIDVADGELKVSAQSEDGDADDFMAVDTGASAHIYVLVKRMLALVSAIDCDEVLLRFGEKPTDPMTAEPATTRPGAYNRQIVMGMHR